MKRLLVFSLAMWMWCPSLAGHGYTPAERVWLDLLSRPTPGTATVYFAMNHRFGVTDVPFDHAIALKNGPVCWFLFEGTERVYRLMRGKEGPYLHRVDSTFHAGGLFSVTAFLRRDTIFRLGGYGFWRTRDFFTWFDVRAGRWERLSTASTLPSTRTLHQYDAEDDALYVAGARVHKPHENFRDELWDSVYCFDFGRRTWSNLGRINPSGVVREVLPDVINYVTITSFGLIKVSFDNTVLVELPGNRVFRLRDREKILFYQFNDPHPDRFKFKRNWIQLGDSLFMLRWTDSSAGLVGIPIRRDLRDRRLQSYRVSEDFAAPLAEAMAANGEELPPAKP